MSLLSLLAALSLTGFLAYTLVGLFNNHFKLLKQARTISSRDLLTAELDRWAADYTLVKRSSLISGNEILNSCLEGVTHAGCTTLPCCPGNTATPFRLLRPSDFTNTTYLAGTDIAPQLYTIEGAPCTTPGPTCPLKASITFTADCGATTPCTKAQNLLTTYTLQQDSSTVASGSFPMKTITRTLAVKLDTAASGGGTTTVSMTTAVCDSSHPGITRYQSGRFEFCDGANWRKVLTSCTIRVALVPATPSNTNQTVQAFCLAGETVTGGGCQGIADGVTGGSRHHDYPSITQGIESWVCSGFVNNGTFNPVAHAICCK